MKYLSLVSLVILLSCGSEPEKASPFFVVNHIDYEEDGDCMYHVSLWVKGKEGTGDQRKEDRCGRWNVGDTIGYAEIFKSEESTPSSTNN